MTAAFDCAPVLLIGFNRPERLKPALQPQSKSAMLPANHRKALVGQPLRNGRCAGNWLAAKKGS